MYKLIGVVFILFLIPAFASASELRLEGPFSPVRAGDTFIVGLSLDTRNEAVNALDGSLTFSSNLTMDSIRLAGSIVPLWILPPMEREPGLISFSGVLPGGYQGSPARVGITGRSNVFTLVFKAQKSGIARISFGPETAVYKNNGEGTRDTLSAPALSFHIGAPSGSIRTDSLPQDTVPPEPFVPFILSGESFGYAGSVLIFSAQDKDSGIQEYAIARSYSSHPREEKLSWRAAESPYALTDEGSDQFLFVRAIDRAGNTRVEVVPPQRISVMALLYRGWFILLGLLFLGGILYRNIRSRL